MAKDRTDERGTFSQVHVGRAFGDREQQPNPSWGVSPGQSRGPALGQAGTRRIEGQRL